MEPQIEQLLSMGGYGIYIWMAYSMAILVIVLNLLMPLWQHQKLLKRIGRRLIQQRKGNAPRS